MGELGALFNPGMRHELEERQAKAARREEEGNAKDGDLRIDLESGVAVINAPGEPGAAGAEREPAGPRTAGESGEADDTGAEAGSPASGEAGASGPHHRATGSGAADEFETAGEPASGHSAVTNTARKSNGRAGDPVAETADQPVAALRPRGKRGVSAAR